MWCIIESSKALNDSKISSIIPGVATVSLYLLYKEGTLSIAPSGDLLFFPLWGLWLHGSNPFRIKWVTPVTQIENRDRWWPVRNKKQNDIWQLIWNQKKRFWLVADTEWEYFWNRTSRLPCGNHFSHVKIELLNNKQLQIHEFIYINHPTSLVKAFVPTAFI